MADNSSSPRPAPSAESRSGSGIVRVGVLIVTTGSLQRLGVEVAGDPETQMAHYRTYADQVNDAGGINGREVELHFRTWDVLDQDDQLAACRYLTQDAKVFAVLGGFMYPAPTLCLVEENKTPLLSSLPQNPDWLFGRAQGRLISLYPRSARMMSTAVREIERSGLTGRRMGILTDERIDPGGRVGGQLRQLLRSAGHEVVYFGQLGQDVAVASSQIPVEVNKAQTAGVGVMVMLTSNAVSGTQFVSQGAGQPFMPRYVSTDWGANNTDTANQNMPESYDGALNFTFAAGDANENPVVDANRTTRCRTMYEKQTGRKLEPGSDEMVGAVGACDAISLFAALASAAGADLTRSSFTAAVSRAQLPPLATVGHGRFFQGKHDYSDMVRTQRWSFECRCWVPVGPFRASQG